MFEENLTEFDETNIPDELWEGAEDAFDEENDAQMQAEDSNTESSLDPDEDTPWIEEDDDDPLIEVDGQMISLTEIGSILSPEPMVPQDMQMSLRDAPYESFLELWERYPHLRNAEEMPLEVLEAVSQGVHPVVAYQDVLLGQQEMENQVLLQREAVRQRSPGSAIGCGDGGNVDLGDVFDAVIDGRI